MVEVGMVALAMAAACYVGFQPRWYGRPEFWLVLGGPVLGLGVFSAARLAVRRRLGPLLRPQWGDLTKGFVVAALLFFLAGSVARWGLSPGSRYEHWLSRLYLHIGNPFANRSHLWIMGVEVIALAVAEELTWRGLVFERLSESMDKGGAWFVATILYGASQIPSMTLLKLPTGEPNPLLVALALAAGGVWGLMVLVTQRLLPGILAHALFLWSVVVMYRLWTPVHP